MLGPDQLGKRVVVRRKYDVVDGRQRYTDVTGELCEFSPASLAVRRDNGEVVTVALDEVVAAKPIPPKIYRRPRP